MLENTHVVVKTEVSPVVTVSVRVPVEMITIVAVVMGSVAPVTEEPLASMVHSVGKPDSPTVTVGIVPGGVPEVASPDSGSRYGLTVGAESI